MTEISFASITGILMWADKGAGVKYLDNCESLPYVHSQGHFHYFTKRGDGLFVLMMTSDIDLNERKA